MEKPKKQKQKKLKKKKKLNQYFKAINVIKSLIQSVNIKPKNDFNIKHIIQIIINIIKAISPRLKSEILNEIIRLILSKAELVCCQGRD